MALTRRGGYVPGDHLMKCDRCGTTYRRSEMEEEWTGLWVCTRGCWEPRHAGDFVEGRYDDQNVDASRPAVEQVVGTTTLNGALTAGAKTAVLTSASGLSSGDPIGVDLDYPGTHWTFITADPSGDTVSLKTELSGPAADGNTVRLPSINNLE